MKSPFADMKGRAGAVSEDERFAIRNGRTGDGSSKSGGEIAACIRQKKNRWAC
jgi:hypothetical protein